MENETSWESVGSWYHGKVGEKGHYYHEHVILPRLLPLLDLSPASSLLDLACGQGILARHLPPKMAYVGIDISNALIREASKMSKAKNHRFLVGDVTKPLPIKETFSHASIVLALQNIEDPLSVLKNAAQSLQKEGKLILVLNHPCFRIPRQSSWQVDEQKKIQYRRIDRYLSPLKIPIQTHPSQREASSQTWSFHHALSDYSRWLKESGFAIEVIEEWCSDKKSTGKAAPMENRSRKEFPLFLTLVARKSCTKIV
jgi:ubiquinone/menaquinone biosynthesis C-methylase UbiE